MFRPRPTSRRCDRKATKTSDAPESHIHARFEMPTSAVSGKLTMKYAGRSKIRITCSPASSASSERFQMRHVAKEGLLPADRQGLLVYL